MLNAIIRFALKQRHLTLAFSLFLIGFGTWQALNMGIDVFPNLNRPRVVVMTEAPGMAPEEVESLITFPLETTLNGATGVQAVRSSSGVGISIIYVEFEWGTDIYNDRQVVNERLQLVTEQLPDGIKPQLAPISSIMGQIMMLGMWSEGGKTSPLEVRTLADWVVRQRLLTIPGVSQVFTMGGGRKQFQVLVDPQALLKYGITLHQVRLATEQSNENATGGYLDEQGPNEFLVRALGRIQTLEDLEKVVVATRNGRPVILSQIAKVIEGPQVKRGDSSAYVKQDDGTFAGGDAVVLTVNKQPNADTRRVSNDVIQALKDLEPSLPKDIRIQPELYSQKSFIDRSIENVIDALVDGGILVVIILFLFLMNFRTTFITLTAIPLSIAITAIIFAIFGLSINTMTLGGLAVAIGELVDDAIVDVENIFRRLQENRYAEQPKHTLLVVFQASCEIRNSIVFGTAIVVLVFLPLFALSGMEGRLFAPLGVAYIVSILSSLLVSLTLTPVLSYWLLGKKFGSPVDPEKRASSEKQGHQDGPLLRFLKWVAGYAISFSIRLAKPMLIAGAAGVIIAGLLLMQLERDFLPPFNEGVAQLNVVLPPGTSLRKSNEISETVMDRLKNIKGVEAFSRRTGRAELDEHAEGVNISEFIISFDPESGRSREQVLEDIRTSMEAIPGIVISVEQPLAHLISHMISGVKAQVGIKIYGESLTVLRNTAKKMETAMNSVPGVTDVLVEPQVEIPQLQIKLNRDKLKLYGLTPAYVNEYVETAMNGIVVSQVLQGQRTFDLLIRMDEKYREDLQALKRLSIDLPGGGTTPLSSVADISASSGPNTINREKVQKRIIVQCNVSGRGLVDVVNDIQAKQRPIVEALPAGYFVEYSGQFESQQSASQMISALFLVSMFGVFLVLFTMFRSANFSLQVMAALPMAFIGSVIALVVTGQTLTIAAMVGFISLGGIASRNGILLLNHYLHLVKYEGEGWTREMIIRAGQERLAPVLMTALTSGIGLVPLAMSQGEAGKEILYPVATVIIGGLLSSTILEFFVRPALFWSCGRNAGARIMAATNADIPLIEEREEETTPVV
ncbi:efflux RND transporter permease subunit [Gimesia sp.]|uniref:efflux RND transporter permease subunit n=1 Tax=Gimesia sp. TaxID=2024833 RepID=UPI000C5918CC|nr:efflux RND transporter permease subunit [Gimesia sp.]MAX40770.1 CusA/CzcA family heavy metal efflux RND transporter [Gimesia sp.]HAH45898.1 CusA/CzcA family heavy metal efflux RND transporter [Planctomycetaceae bacterium]